MEKLKERLIKYIDWVYNHLPLVRKFFPLLTFRYAVCGWSNIGLDMLIYFIVFHYVLFKQGLDIGFIFIKPEIAAFMITFPITFTTGFWLARNVTFEGVKGGTKELSLRYMIVVLINLTIKYWGLRLCVEVLRIFPSISNAITNMTTVAVSYLLQRKFTFKGHQLPQDISKNKNRWIGW